MVLCGASEMAGAEAAPTFALEEAVVRGQAGERLRVRRASSATLTDTPLKDVPQSVGVVTRTALDDFGARRLDTALDWVSGISRQNNLGGMADNFAIRGFAGDINTGADYLVNGFSANRANNVPVDAINIARIDVLKGPSAALYGRSDPGGIVNIVTRTPQFKPSREITLSVGSHDQYRLATELTGPLSERLAYRLGVAAESNHSFRDFSSSRRYVIAPSFTWLATDDTVVTYAFEAAQLKAPFDRGIVAINKQLGALPNSRFLGEPGDGDTTVRTQSHQLTAEHQLNEGWKLNAGLSYRTSALFGKSSDASRLLADGRTLWRQARERDYHANDLAGRVDVQGDVHTGAVKHTLVAGADFYNFRYDPVMYRANPSAAAPYAIDIFNPVYGQPRPALRPSISTRETQRGFGAFVQDQITLTPQWKLLAGVRMDRFLQHADNRLTGESVSQQQTAYSPRLGLVYQPTQALSLYANTSRSFRPNTGTGAQGNAFAPERGRGYEVGAKLETADGKFGGTLALYSIDKTNVLTGDPRDPTFQRTAGAVRSRGVELDVSGQVTANLKVMGAYAYTDATVTADTVLPAGAPLSNIPRHSASVLGLYEFGAGALGRAGAGGGVVYVGERAGNSVDNGFKLPAYTTVRLHGYVQPTRALRLSLTVDNLFDKRYYASSYNELWVAPGAERQVTLAATYKF
ncbi:TonB-dependent siderophore receptor [Ralstonia insidiosa]|jgi:iron complex outermembrane receptor protein|uniref:TonB-dependent siderophore receptor n=1 Tax=Ralstonia TaxID=48736 RepID=UPI0006649BFA|nr:TonB-dependent siderophore receptor [Ralstonia insidiosa]KMW47397.1 membrane protein [Ralstonia sp. MD27]MBX3773644.1 TonB-dependent siderophore receptor [Ralstonia pickettii]NOZ18307.1 TonB-dependent siderophore receptor [Betaproteobacteria bacterium]MBA9857575.1 TonB-dependent siderophore receptor [Ralstonia insidiosa]MBA9870906.1 TonB-dependent siderophore receptor [Ralstonia insidiosa]